MLGINKPAFMKIFTDFGILTTPICLRQEAPEGNADARAAPSLCITALDGLLLQREKPAIPTRAEGCGELEG